MQTALQAAEAAPGIPSGVEPDLPAGSGGSGLYRIGETAMYSVDPLCRRAAPLQQTVQAQSRFVGLNPADAERLGLAEGAAARVSQGEGEVELEVKVTHRVPEGGVWVRSATCATSTLGHAIGPVRVEAA